MFPAQVELFRHDHPFVRPERLHLLLSLKKPVDLVLHVVRHENAGLRHLLAFRRGYRHRSFTHLLDRSRGNFGIRA